MAIPPTARNRNLIWSLLVLALACPGPGIFRVEPSTVMAAQAGAVASAAELEQAISDHLMQVEEFRFIREQSKELGIRAWLFGGTAAGYGHYVNWDLHRVKGDSHFQTSRFDYDYTSIYRSTQDLDIVIDGSEAQADLLEARLREKFPHLQGMKSAWEVRLLRSDRLDKAALLDNPDYLNQHTDSNSTGMIELSPPPPGESVVRDLRDWKSTDPIFMENLRLGKLHYYFSPTHAETKRYREGMNPPILSAIRYLTKAFQYGLEIEPEDFGRIKQVIAEFNPARDLRNPYVSHWIEKNGKKLIQNAISNEYAIKTMDILGLRQILRQLPGANVNWVDSLAWWMNKEPLRAKPVGQGSGPTAAQLGMTTVAHDVRDTLTYDSITRSYKGEPNVLISRPGFEGESAAAGSGFYTVLGETGALGTGITVRFQVDPAARLGSDFDIDRPIDPQTRRLVPGTHVIWKNSAGLQIMPESLDTGYLPYLKSLAQGQDWEKSDRGLFERLKRRIERHRNNLTSQEEAAGAELIEQNLGLIETRIPLIMEWLASDSCRRFPRLLSQIYDAYFQQFHTRYHHYISPQEYMALNPIGSELSNRFHDLEPETRAEILRMVSEDVEVLARSHSNDERPDPFLIQQWFKIPESAQHPELVEKLFKNPDNGPFVARWVLSHAHFANHPEWLGRLLNGDLRTKGQALLLLREPLWATHPEFVEKILHEDPLLKDPTHASAYIFLFTAPTWKDHPEWLEDLIDRISALPKGHSLLESIARDVLSKEYWHSPSMVRRLIDAGEAESVIRYVLSQPHWKDHPEFVEELLDRQPDGRLGKNSMAALAVDHILSKPHWQTHPEWVSSVLAEDSNYLDARMRMLVLPHWKRQGSRYYPLWEKAMSLHGEDRRRVILETRLIDEQSIGACIVSSVSGARPQ